MAIGEFVVWELFSKAIYHSRIFGIGKGEEDTFFGFGLCGRCGLFPHFWKFVSLLLEMWDEVEWAERSMAVLEP